MNDIGQELKKRRLELGLTLEDVGKSVGVTKSTVRKWETGYIANMKRDKIASLAEVLQVSPLFIMGRIDDTEKSDQAQDKDQNKKASSISIEDINGYVPFVKNVPIIGLISAGTPIFAEQNIEGYIPVTDKRIDYLLRVQGDSMINANIFDGAYVEVEKETEINNGDIVIALVNGDEATIKRFYQYNDNVILRPENPTLKEQEYPAKDVKILGKVRYVRFNVS